MTDGFAAAICAGLSARPKSLPCRYFYDAEGSRLFEEICRQPEYYLTRAEREILVAHADEIAARPTLVEFGSGNAEKTRLLIASARRRYVPIDISPSALDVEALRRDFPGLSVEPIAAEYREGLRRLERDGPMLVVFIGSNIGNFTRDEARGFLNGIAELMAPEDRLLLGVDLRKDPAVLEAAYDDAAGVTARFNLNLLARINRELGGTFDLDAFAHRATYDAVDGRVSMWLVSARAQRVRVGADAFDFAAGEAIHTEDSYKYSSEEIDAVASAFRMERRWFDAGGRFCLSLFEPAP